MSVSSATAPSVNALTIGSAMVDIIAMIADADVERVTLHNATTSFLMVEPGRKIDAEDIQIRTGGGAVNVAISLKRQGAGVDVLARLGSDLNAQKVRNHLADGGIGTDWLIQDADQPTGSSVMIAAHDKDAAIYTQRGANTCLTLEDIAAVPFERYDLVYVSPLSKASARILVPVIERAKSAGAFTVCTPGKRQIATRAPDLMQILPNLDLMVMNVSEAEALMPVLIARCQTCPIPLEPRQTVGVQARLAAGLRVQDEAFPMPWFFRQLMEAGLRYVAVTDGADGAWLASGQDVWHCPIHGVEVRGTAGAGDAFCSTLAYGLACGMDPETALKRAVINAAGAVSHADTQTGLLNGADLDRHAAQSSLQVTHWPAGLI